ncbi:uncharacterized histidine-rich protein DDB_G0274557-like [Sesamum indicum]|uniref:Uncharacterized histidine-rich protein DDB_G0274557-like n=1 Tax=Sesamum indicum TaxID=4182 RepID=A0A6I9TYK7_SESIN|nr:uncharacterized histidine-rich protein DDB_G0274557-like [Sesamum indicum]
MDSNSDGKTPTPTSFHPPHHHHHHHGHHSRHHHHFFYISPHCPFHRSMSQPKNHSPSCSFSTYYPSPQNPEPVASIPPNSHSSFLDNQPNESFDDSQMMQDNIENVEVEEEDDPIYVLTDEWRDFFAKSEAKRRLAKKQAKKGKN